MRALFIQQPEPHCGVFQYGRNLFSILESSTRIRWEYAECSNVGDLRARSALPAPDAVVYNWQAGQGGFMSGAPFPWLKKQVLVYHDLDLQEASWDAILFSDPTMTSRGKWHSIGRPLPMMKYWPNPASEVAVVGVHGFLGAWADQVVQQVKQEFEFAVIRLQLPFSKFCDPDGLLARAMACRCQEMVNGTNLKLEINHEFLPPPSLLEWLSQNTINCYFRPVEMGWRGISSAPDSALAVRRPVAVNRCNAFRHLHNLSPSVCIEENRLGQIIANGLNPLVPLYQKWDSETVRGQVEDVLLRL